MPDTCPYVEILQSSREITATKTSTKQQIVIRFRLEEDYMGDLVEPVFDEAEFLGATDDVLALETAYNLLPESRSLPNSDGLKLRLELTEVKVGQIDNDDWWEATATYSYDENDGTGGEQGQPGDKTLPYIRIGFGGGGQTKRRSQSYDTSVGAPRVGGSRPAPDIRKTIGLTEDNVEGVEVPGGGLALTVTAYYYPSVINSTAFLRAVANLFTPEAPLNSDTFLGFVAGEVVLLSMTGDYTLNSIVPVTFEFSIKLNIVNQPDAPFPNLTCDGHAHIEYVYVKQLDPAAQTMLQLPEFRYIHQVHNKKAFSVLGIPQAIGP